MSKHTPGPWEFIEYGTLNAAVRIHDDCLVEGAYQGGDSDLLSPEDARLIAAAPELLDALEAALLLVDMSTSYRREDIGDMARAAIKKARGL